MLSLSKLFSIVCIATAVAAGPSSKRQDDPALNPVTPVGYVLVFGPKNAATNSADGFMGFTNFDTYDVQGCADACTNRAADAEGGPCKYINIWRAVIDEKVGPTTCSFYYTATDETTATNSGQGSIQITYSRGYVVTTA